MIQSCSAASREHSCGKGGLRHIEGQPLPASVPAPRQRSAVTDFWSEFRRNRLAVVALAFIALVVASAIFAPVVANAIAHPPNAQYPERLDQNFGTPTGPSRDFLFGVDTVG